MSLWVSFMKSDKVAMTASRIACLPVLWVSGKSRPMAKDSALTMICVCAAVRFALLRYTRIILKGLLLREAAPEEAGLPLRRGT